MRRVVGKCLKKRDLANCKIIIRHLVLCKVWFYSSSFRQT